MTKKFIRHRGMIAPLDRANVDTDAIIPKQFLQKVTRSGFGQHLFHNWRFSDDDGQQPDPTFVLNQPIYQGASILLARENFGCGSSREHAPWALTDYGFNVIIAPTFADIFYNNCFNNQLLPVKLSETAVEELFALTAALPGVTAEICLVQQTVRCSTQQWSFDVDDFGRHCLLNGLDSIDLTLQYAAAIDAYEARQPAWMR